MKPTLREQVEKQEKRVTAQAEATATAMEGISTTADVTFVVLAQNDMLDEALIIENPDKFIIWDDNFRGKAGTIVRDFKDGEEGLFKAIHDISDAGQNRKPFDTPSMWTRIGNPEEEYPEWFQPLGAHDAYAKDAKVTHNDKKWISNIDGNVWEPSVYGWTEVKE